MSHPDVGTERTLPANLEAERSVLGAILLHNDAYEVVNGVIGANDFFRDAHRRIYAALDRLLEWKDGSADLTLLKEELNKHGDLDECGGPAYIASLIDGVPRHTNVRHYAEVVKEKARLRGLIFAANKMLSSAYAAEEPASTILSAADLALVELQTEGGSGSLVKLGADTSGLMEDIEWRVAHQGQVTGIDTGYPSLNASTLGWQPGHLIVIAARPSIGKSTFAGNVTVAAGRAGKRVGVFSFEMKRLQWQYRMLAALSGVPAMRTKSGLLMAPDWAKVAEAVGVMHDLPIYIDDRRGQTVQDVRTACRRMKAEEGLDMVVIDYVQLMPGSLGRKGANRNDEIQDISRRLATMAGDLSIPVILLSQLNRQAASRPDPRPRLSDLRDSGALEQDADEVLLLHRKNHREAGLTYAIMEKERDGSTGTFPLMLDRDILLFSDAPDAEEPAPPAKEERAPRPPRRYARRGEN